MPSLLQNQLLRLLTPPERRSTGVQEIYGGEWVYWARSTVNNSGVEKTFQTRAVSLIALGCLNLSERSSLTMDYLLLEKFQRIFYQNLFLRKFRLQLARLIHLQSIKN